MIDGPTLSFSGRTGRVPSKDTVRTVFGFVVVEYLLVGIHDEAGLHSSKEQRPQRQKCETHGAISLSYPLYFPVYDYAPQWSRKMWLRCEFPSQKENRAAVLKSAFRLTQRPGSHSHSTNGYLRSNLRGQVVESVRDPS